MLFDAFVVFFRLDGPFETNMRLTISPWPLPYRAVLSPRKTIPRIISVIL